MLYLSTVESTTLELLKKLQQLPILCNTRLVGGTALALQLGHRKSIDLDLFGRINADSQELQEALRTIGTLTILSDSKNIHIYVLNEVKIDIVNYTYPWLSDVVCKDGIRLASPKDIAAMKITAVKGRGTKKDFVDIYFLLKRYSLKKILDFYSRKYPDSSSFMAMKSLAYFEDAEEEPMPYMFIDVSWDEIKQNILSHL
ncbi:nucleotidyl transferase AbiEii/AbiGii toxin family protein [uncultured Bacteroides sp.]|uniref:nucleotidyl transferase AbiEii/AbiGii toxin family protein n=1 Tax=uncultured Bacteroides sp. TaxID=162156 RepID=UPI0025F88904|nr:nucleotidyl transferase AbiEii/AbiGii toxin family protein [uncultured Bacteroides sp.]